MRGEDIIVKYLFGLTDKVFESIFDCHELKMVIILLFDLKCNPIVGKLDGSLEG